MRRETPRSWTWSFSRRRATESPKVGENRGIDHFTDRLPGCLSVAGKRADWILGGERPEELQLISSEAGSKAGGGQETLIPVNGSAETSYEAVYAVNEPQKQMSEGRA